MPLATLHPAKSVATTRPSSRTRPSTSRPAHALHLWHLLSLDAPTVATLWTALLARSSSVRLPPATLPAMFLAVWLLYAADRLLDARLLDAPFLRGRHPPPRPAPTHPKLVHEPAPILLGLELRHLFHHRHRHAFLLALTLVAVTLAFLIPQLDRAALRLDLLLGALLLAYFALIHAPQSHSRLPKEIAVGVFFSAAVFLPTVAARPALRPALLPVAFLFAFLCSLNCVAIFAWEHPTPTHPQQPHRLSRLGIALLTPALAVLALAAFALAPVSPFPAPLLASALAAVLLLVLHHLHPRLPPLTLRALADLALTTPVLFLLHHL